MPPGIDLQQVWNQYGAVGVILFLASLALINAFRNRAATRDQTEKTASNVSAVLADNIGRLGEAILKMSADASHERNENLMVIRDMTGQIKGVLSVLDTTRKEQRGVADTLSEVADRIAPIQTDLRDVSKQTAAIPLAFTAMLDERVGPLVSLVIGMNTQVNAIAANVKANGQNDELLLAEVSKINENTAKIISEVALLKDLFFDRDDHLGKHVQHILNALNVKETSNP
jgi:signal transduction histidine kinase